MPQGIETENDRELLPQSNLRWGERLAICRQRVRLILSMSVAVAVCAAMWSFLQAPVYEAKVSLLIDRDAKFLQADMPEAPWDYQLTQLEMLKSSAVLSEAIRRLDFPQEAEFSPDASPIQNILGIILPTAFQRETQDASPLAYASSEQAQNKKVTSFRKMIMIKPVPGIRMVDIVVEAGDPQFAARAANTLAAVYIDRSLETKLRSSEYAAQWFTKRLEELRHKLEESEQARNAYQAKYGFKDSYTQASIVEQRLADLSAELNKAEIKRAEVQTAFEQHQAIVRDQAGRRTNELPTLLRLAARHNTPRIQNLLLEEQKLSRELSEMSKRFSSLHPKVKRAQFELKTLQSQIKTELYNALENDCNTALAQEQNLREALTKLKNQKRSADEHLVQYYLLDREAISNRQLYDSVLKQMKEAQLAKELTLNNIVLADPAVPIPDPVKPKKTANTILGFLIGLASSISLAFLLEARDGSIKGPEDLNKYFPGLVCLGLVPFIKRTRKQEIGQLFPVTPAADSYRAIRASLLVSTEDQYPESVLITSPGPNEGKSTLAANLAIAMAQLKQDPVILIDADLRKPRIEQIFGMKAKGGIGGGAIGLAHYLAGKANIEEIMHATSSPYLFVIPSGGVPPNPSELLHSKAMTVLLERFRAGRYRVILDAPPVLPVMDPIVLGRQVAGVVLVISARETWRDACRSAAKRLTTPGIKMLGVILQKVKRDDMPPYYLDSRC